MRLDDARAPDLKDGGIGNGIYFDHIDVNALFNEEIHNVHSYKVNAIGSSMTSASYVFVALYGLLTAT